MEVLVPVNASLEEEDIRKLIEGKLMQEGRILEIHGCFKCNRTRDDNWFVTGFEWCLFGSGAL